METKINSTLSVADKLIEITGWMLVALLWFFTIRIYFILPEIVPVHFDAAGNPNRYGSKSMLFFIDAIGTIIFIIMLVLSRAISSLTNLADNFHDQEKIIFHKKETGKLFRILAIIVLLIVFIIVFSVYGAMKGETALFGSWIPYVITGMFILPTIYYLIRINSRKNT